MKKHAYIAHDQLWVISGPDEQTPYFVKGSYVWANYGPHDARQVFVQSASGDGSDAMHASSLEAVAEKMGATIHATEAEAEAAFAAQIRVLDWIEVAEGLFGPDYIAPLSEVLHVNRRTVERWRSGAVAIPVSVKDDIEDLGKRGRAHRSYGMMLRRVASGEDPQDVYAAASDLVADIDEGQPIAMRAARK